MKPKNYTSESNAQFLEWVMQELHVTTNQDLAKALKMVPSHTSGIKNGFHPIGLLLICRFCDLTNIPLKEVLDRAKFKIENGAINFFSEKKIPNQFLDLVSEKLGITKDCKLSLRLGVSNNVISNIRKGKSKPQPKVIMKAHLLTNHDLKELMKIADCEFFHE